MDSWDASTVSPSINSNRKRVALCHGAGGQYLGRTVCVASVCKAGPIGCGGGCGHRQPERRWADPRSWQPRRAAVLFDCRLHGRMAHARSASVRKIHRIAPFALRNQGPDGDQRDAARQIYVANFFFSSCPMVCPKMLANLRRIQAAFQNDAQVGWFHTRSCPMSTL